MSDFLDGLRSAARASENYVLGDVNWSHWAIASGRPFVYLALLFAGGGWYGLPVKPAPKEVTYLVRESESGPDKIERRTMAVPISLHLGFDPAGLDADVNPSGPGVELEPVRWKALGPTVKLLEKCAEQLEGGLKVQVLGFASEEQFRPFKGEKNNKLNLKTANQRASSVSDALHKIAVEDSQISFKPKHWEAYTEMEASRNHLILAEPEDHRAHRVAVLRVPGLGSCAIEDLEPPEQGDE